MRCVVALPGETAECLCHGLAVVFEHIGMVPRVLVIDNATGAGHRNPDGSVTQTRLFSLLCAHYGFEARFCNPYSGHEKGSVENAVGFVRRNLMVPVPSAESMEALSAAWLAECDRIAARAHYRKGEPIRGLFETELDHMLALPGVRFDACDWRMVKADKTGTVTVDGNRYLAGPKWRSSRIRAGVRAFSIEMRDPDGGHIVTLERAWGHEPRTRLDPSTLLAVIARKPRAWGESPIRGDFPQPVRELLDRMDGKARRDLIDDIRAVSSSCGFAAAVKAAAMVIDAGRSLDRAAIETTARRILQGGSGDSAADLKRYDKYMEAHDER
ncbi:DDE-type integrase/transposase/recombinase, partial [Bifidobacterium oedipodis]